MTVISVQCLNCGAKYKLPETYEKPHAKCKGCGATIDVAAQRMAAAAPKAPEPKPVVTPPRKETRTTAARKPAAASEPAPTRSKAGGRKSREERDVAERPERPERPGRAGRSGRTIPAEPKKNNALIIGSIVGLLAVVAVVLVFVMSGDKEPAAQQTAQGAGTRPDGQPPAQANPSVPPPANEGAAPAAAPRPDPTPPASATGAAETAETTETAGTTGTGEAAVKPAGKPPAASTGRTAEAGTTPGAGKPVSKITSRDEVYDPRKDAELTPLPFADDVTDEEKTRLTELMTSIEDGGLAGKRAKDALQGMGHKALAPTINRLLAIDYLDADQSMFAYELNKMLEAMLLGLNLGFKPVLPGEDVDLDTADRNAKTARVWRRETAKWNSKETFDQLIKSQKAKRQEAPR